MYKNQLGRRNLTDEQKTYLLGKMYEARKHTKGGQVGNQNAVKRRDQIGHIVSGRIKEQIANEQHVGQGNVQRAEYFAKGIDAIREEEPEQHIPARMPGRKQHQQRQNDFYSESFPVSSASDFSSVRF